MIAGVHAFMVLCGFALHWVCSMTPTAVVACNGLQMAPEGTARNEEVAKPTGLFAFLLYMCCMGLWSLRMKSFGRKSLHRSIVSICAVLLSPSLYGMALSLWHCSFVWMLGVSVFYAARRRILMHHKCHRAVAVERTCASPGIKKPKPWNVSCIKGSKNKNMTRMMFCYIFRPISCKIRIQEGCHYVWSVVLVGALCTCSGFLAWQRVWQEYRLVRLMLFVLFWLLCGGHTEYGCLSVVCLLCTLGNLHCSWCKMLSFATCWLVCPSHNATVAAVFAILVPFAPRVVFPMLEIRNSSSRQKEAKCLRWRCRNTEMLITHAELFKGHGMDPGASCHTLETKPLSAEECAALKEQIVAAISTQENFLDKYNILWDRMKTFMTWDRIAIGIERTSDASVGRATVQVQNPVVQQRLERVFRDGTKKMYRSSTIVLSGLQPCVQKYREELGSCYGPLEVGDCLCRFFEEVRENRLVWQSRELGRKSLPLEAACRSVALRRAQERQEPTSELLRDFSIVNVMQAKQGQNTFTGLVNFQSLTCWLNSAVQLLWHSEFVYEWLHYSETVERTSLQRPFPSKEFSQLFKWIGNYEVVAPIELLHFVLDHWQNYGFIDRQCDAMEFLQVVHQLSNAPESTEQVSVCFNAGPLRQSDTLGEECSLQEFVDLQLKQRHGTLATVSKEILLQTIPFVVNEVTAELSWIASKIVDWSAEVDLRMLFTEMSEMQPRCLASKTLFCVSCV